MRLIDRYICRQLFSHAFLGLGIFTFVFFVPQLVRLMDLVVRHPGSWSTILILFLSTFPDILIFTLPMGVLVGVLIALGRLSADSELIAMSALGMGRRRLLVPVGFLAFGATGLAFVMTLWLGPLSARTFRTLEDRLRAGQASYQVAPRVFDERFPRMVLYVNDIDSAATRWKGVFLAGTDKGVSRLTLAEEAIVIADRSEGKLELHLRNGSVHEFSTDDPDHYSLSAFGQRDLPVEIKPTEDDHVSEPGIPGRTMTALWKERKSQREAIVEIQRRLSFPFACIAFALLAMPIGARPRRGGRAAGFHDHPATDYRLLPDVHDRDGTGAPGRDSHLGGHLVGEPDYRRTGVVSAAAAGAHAGQQPDRRCMGTDIRLASLEDFLARETGSTGSPERHIPREPGFQQEKGPHRHPPASGRVSAAQLCLLFRIY